MARCARRMRRSAAEPGVPCCWFSRTPGSTLRAVPAARSASGVRRPAECHDHLRSCHDRVAPPAVRRCARRKRSGTATGPAIGAGLRSTCRAQRPIVTGKPAVVLTRRRAPACRVREYRLRKDPPPADAARVSVPPKRQNVPLLTHSWDALGTCQKASALSPGLDCRALAAGVLIAPGSATVPRCAANAFRSGRGGGARNRSYFRKTNNLEGSMSYQFRSLAAKASALAKPAAISFSQKGDI